MSKDPAPTADGREILDDLLQRAAQRQASDIHIEPTAAGYEIRYRVDGLLETVTTFPFETGRAMVGRLMVLAQLLTYRLDVPQEGRLSVALQAGNPAPQDLRLAVMPTTHGLRAAVRLSTSAGQPLELHQLGLSTSAIEGLKRFARADSGMLVITGPAGSGKTTTIYALLRYIAQTHPGLSLISLEDPVERDLPGVTQIEVKPFGELTYERALRSILRQDPQVLMLGEIRDAPTASLALQAALSGHRLICTLHASDAGGAIARLLEMEIAPYQISSALFGVVAQRLLRRQSGDGYRGRVPVAEFVEMDEPLRKAVVGSSDASTIQNIYRQQQGYVPLRTAADALVARKITDAAEIERVLGIG